LQLSGEQAADIIDVERQVSALNMAHPGLVSLEALARLLLRAEAVASSFIEGLRINVRRLVKRTSSTSPDSARLTTPRAVLGNVAAMDSALSLADAGRDITVQDICDLHARLFTGPATRSGAHSCARSRTGSVAQGSPLHRGVRPAASRSGAGTPP